MKCSHYCRLSSLQCHCTAPTRDHAPLQMRLQLRGEPRTEYETTERCQRAHSSFGSRVPLSVDFRYRAPRRGRRRPFGRQLWRQVK